MAVVQESEQPCVMQKYVQEVSAAAQGNALAGTLRLGNKPHPISNLLPQWASWQLAQPAMVAYFQK